MIGTAVTLAIVFILVALLASVIFSDYADSPRSEAPSAKLQIVLSEGNSVEFEHDGGDPIYFDSSAVAVILQVNDLFYALNDTALGTLETGETKFLPLNESGLPAMELDPEDEVSVKVVDYNSGVLVAYRELEIGEHIVIEPNSSL